MRIYIAGPMTGYPDFNKPAFAAESARLRALGFEVVNPAELNEGSDGDWLACMRTDIKELVECDGIALLPGWEQSKGVKVEHAIARGLEMRVFQARHIIGLAGGEIPVISQEAVVEVMEELESRASAQIAEAQ